jgi:hypothetical protein
MAGQQYVQSIFDRNVTVGKQQQAAGRGEL